MNRKSVIADLMNAILIRILKIIYIIKMRENKKQDKKRQLLQLMVNLNQEKSLNCERNLYTLTTIYLFIKNKLKLTNMQVI